MKKAIYYYLLMLLVYLPLQGLVSTLLSNYLPASVAFWFTHWYELALIVAILIGAISLIKSRSCPNFKAFNQPALYFVAFSLISALFLASDFSRGLEGFRFTALAVVFLIYAGASQLSNESTQSLLKTYLIMAVVVAVWAILERLMPLNYWQAIGFPDFGWGKYHLANRIFQSASIMNGPNQVASYLLPAFFISLSGLLSKKFKLSTCLMALVLLAAIIFTFSRSAAIALVATSILAITLSPISKRIKLILAGIAIIVVAAGSLIFKSSSGNIQALIYHGPSQADHEKSLQISIDALKTRSFDKLMIGGGIGSAGPAALKYGDGIISESWYLQLILELGVIGLVLWIWLIADLLVRLYRAKSELFYGLMAISITAIFLHSWADNPAMSITFMLLLGAKYKLII